MMLLYYVYMVILKFFFIASLSLIKMSLDFLEEHTLIQTPYWI